MGVNTHTRTHTHLLPHMHAHEHTHTQRPWQACSYTPGPSSTFWACNQSPGPGTKHLGPEHDPGLQLKAASSLLRAAGTSRLVTGPLCSHVPRASSWWPQAP